MNKQEFKRIHEEIRQVLLKEWDPIGVADNPEVHDEYDTYIPQIIGLLLKRATAEEIAEYLNGVETREMGLGLHSSDELLPVACLLLKLT